MASDRGEILAEAAAITDLVAKSTSSAEDSITNIAVLVDGAKKLPKRFWKESDFSH